MLNYVTTCGEVPTSIEVCRVKTRQKRIDERQGGEYKREAQVRRSMTVGSVILTRQVVHTLSVNRGLPSLPVKSRQCNERANLRRIIGTAREPYDPQISSISNCREDLALYDSVYRIIPRSPGISQLPTSLLLGKWHWDLTVRISIFR